MHRRPGSPLTAAPAGWAAAGAAAVTLARAAWRQGRAIAAARACAARGAPAFSRPHPRPAGRVLVLGDSTGVGLGADPRTESVAAWLAREHPAADVLNLSASGARLRDMRRQAAGAAALGPWDLVLLLGGGNDVIGRTPWLSLAADADLLLGELRSQSRHVVWAGMANVGLAPMFVRPLGWLLSLRTRRAVQVFRSASERQGVHFVDFFREAGEDPFSAEPQRYYASDGVHPSAQAYALCWRTLRPAVARALPQNFV